MKNFTVNFLRPELARSLWSSMPIEQDKRPKKATVVHGPKVRAATSHPSTKQPDAFILEVRRLRETEGMGYKRIAKRLGISEGRASQICDYAVRAHLVPEVRSEPYWPE